MASLDFKVRSICVILLEKADYDFRFPVLCRGECLQQQLAEPVGHRSRSQSPVVRPNSSVIETDNYLNSVTNLLGEAVTNLALFRVSFLTSKPYIPPTQCGTLSVATKLSTTFICTVRSSKNMARLPVEAVFCLPDDDICHKRLNPATTARHDPDRVCMENTRVKILDKIAKWTSSYTPQTLFWIYGGPGTGKSCIASSVAKQLLAENRLGGSFFCNRDDAKLCNPRVLMATLCYQLLATFPPYGELVTAILRKQPMLGVSLLPLFEELFVTPLQQLQSYHLTGPGPLVIVIDALDECGIPDGGRSLLEILQQLSGLVPWLKILITTRLNAVIYRFLQNDDGVLCCDLGEEDVLEDIKLIARHQMAAITNDPLWPGEFKIQQMAEQACGLFIWVQMAYKFVSKSLNRNRALDHILCGKSSNVPAQELAKLYTTVLEDTIEVDDSIQDFQDVMGIILTSCVPLQIQTFQALLHGQVNSETVDCVREAFSSVLYEDKKQNDAIRVYHPSFTEFLSDETHCPPKYLIDLAVHHARLSENCLKIMIEQLNFNICGLKTSHSFNPDIVDCSALSNELQYS
jgi:hypothetical protein